MPKVASGGLHPEVATNSFFDSYYHTNKGINGLLAGGLRNCYTFWAVLVYIVASRPLIGLPTLLAIMRTLTRLRIKTFLEFSVMPPS